MISTRRAMLFIPGNNPAMIRAAAHFGADAVILDLEDAVLPSEKDAARILVRQALQTEDFAAAEKIVRINPLYTLFGLDDLAVVLGAGVDTIMLPKADPDHIERLNQAMDEILNHQRDSEPRGATREIGVIALVETARGLEEAYQSARGRRVNGLFLGAEDLTADMGMTRTKEGSELLYARCRLVTAAKAARVHVIDTPYTDAADEEGLAREVSAIKQLGFTGKACIHPRQVKIVQQGLAPTQDEIRWAQTVVEASQEAERQGLGAVAVDGKMIDAPILARARAVLARAEAAGLLPRREGVSSDGC